MGSGAFSSGLSFHPDGFSLVPGFRALLPGQSSHAAASVVWSVSPFGVPTGSVGVVGCVPGPVAPPVAPLWCLLVPWVSFTLESIITNQLFIRFCCFVLGN